ncbi:toxin-antitoxin system, antitoxin component, AbrB family [Leptospira weilii str. UI 13098]|uniref:Toxin-antitoxin system, antitoxin component, AbrB family n=1 Tax=Leptospira weilii str. UI 13098 TaxID=1088542 RepID=M6QB91_9LEPT|nr:toxin-antitoxin system, antitoxin component, AbrB family [Leptospira weilii str. UI 13098]
MEVGGHLEVIHYGNRIELIPIEPIKKLKGFLKGMNTKMLRKKFQKMKKYL